MLPQTREWEPEEEQLALLGLWGRAADLLRTLHHQGLAPVSPKTKRRAAKTRPFEKRQTPRSQTERKAGGPPGPQPVPGAPAPPLPPPAHALGGMDAELIDEEALTSLELELGLHRVRDLPELFLGQSEFDCFSDLGSAQPAGSVSC
ncbi:cbp/p300-interacting transactivator 4 [Neophocaena asiaeorientalis asiaeorientalis]|uniref:Cbp/p300-interacting transactivator 4 n=1 Tax=Neophocaena asiaeorientalis asiaeorientalis TaxID=1706337 RepID=A0A341AVH5_NEOAA|nr:cbp/p300-interacting transactivator 4 [Neophocaena asiaeorientalis asiaeorientalis]